jgi:hypothetical protein
VGTGHAASSHGLFETEIEPISHFVSLRTFITLGLLSLAAR